MKKSYYWVLAIGVALLGTIFRFMFNFMAGILAAALFALLVPLDEWQAYMQTFVNGRTRKVLIVVLTILFCLCSVFGVVLFSAVTSDDTTATDTPTTTTAVTLRTTTTTALLTTTTTVKTTTSSTSTTTATTATTATTTATTTVETTTTTVATTVHTHSFTDADCTTPKTCICGATEGRELGHSWEDATCLSPKKCSRCGAESGDVADHSYSDGTCRVCGESDPDYSSGYLVWIPTNGGTKYHSHSGCSQMEDPRQVTEDEAIAMGFTPCKRCY